MATADGDAAGLGAVSDLLDRYGLDWVRLAVVDVAILALVLRVFELGGRVAHWDEARVGFWILEYMQTGNFQYRPIIHGPFYHHINRLVFEVFGVSDFNMRLVVAIAGGLFPLTALLFRERLRDSEVVALAVFLAVNPVLLYYSRFMRGDPLVAMFMFTAFALFVRLADTGDRDYLYGGVAFVALGFTVKENALIYVVTWLGATALLVDHRLFRASDRDQPWTPCSTTTRSGRGDSSRRISFRSPSRRWSFWLSSSTSTHRAPRPNPAPVSGRRSRTLGCSRT
jgi:uncharacterized protein (TIGR03663 family)